MKPAMLEPSATGRLGDHNRSVSVLISASGGGVVRVVPRAGHTGRRTDASDGIRPRLADELLRARPFTVAGRGVEVSDRAEIHDAAPPCPGQLGDAVEIGQGVVGARRDDAGEGQGCPWHGQPAVLAQGLRCGVALGQRRAEVRRRRQQRARDRTPVPSRPVRDGHDPGAVGDHDDRTGDVRQHFVQGGDLGAAAQPAARQRRDGPGVGDPVGENGLPVIRHVIAQSGNDDDRRWCGGTHVEGSGFMRVAAGSRARRRRSPS